MAFSLRDNPKPMSCWDLETPALSISRNADIFRRMNTMLGKTLLGNALELAGVCFTPSTRTQRDSIMDWVDSGLCAARSRMLFSSNGPEESRALPDVSELGLGLQSLSQHSYSPSNNSNASMLGMMGRPLGQLLNKPHTYSSSESNTGASDFFEKFPTLARLNSRSLLDSHSSSPVDAEISGFSSSSDHLSDLLESQHTCRVCSRCPLAPLGSRLDHEGSPLTPSPSATPGGVSRRVPPNLDLLETPDSLSSIEREARLHRQAAAINNATITWSGQLPPRIYNNPVYSCKVFLGGVPWDITEADLITTFNCFSFLSVAWPGKDGDHPRCPPKGYVYLIFDSEKTVRALLQSCTQELLHPEGYSEYYFKMSSKTIHCRDVQVIPCVISDNDYVRDCQRLDPANTVFVGALHGKLNAEALASIMNDLFGGVIYAGLNTDRHMYPIGSGRVTFNNHRSYLKAVGAAFVKIKTPKFTKKVQIDPYLEDYVCQVCSRLPGPFFCRDQACFKYYCHSCWNWQHSVDILRNHRPLKRKPKNWDSS